MFDLDSTTLGDLARDGVLTFGDGYRTRQDQLSTSGYRVLRVADIDNGAVHTTGPDFVHEAFGKAIGAKSGRPGDVLLTTKGSVGRVAILPETNERIVYSPQLCFFRVIRREVLDPRFLAHWFKSSAFVSQSSHMQSNTDMAPYISLTDLKTVKIVLPTQKRQRAIAEVLGALDDKIAANNKLADTIWSFAENSYRALVMGVPASHRVSDVLTLEYGKPLPAGARNGGSVSVVGSGGVVGHHDVALVPNSGVVVGRKGSAGTVHWVNGEHWPIDTTFWVNPQPGVSEVFAFFLLTELGLANMNNDSAVPGLNRNEAQALLVRRPNLDSLLSFTKSSQHLLDTAAAKEAENRSLAILRDTLLPQLISGKLRVRDAERAVGEVL